MDLLKKATLHGKNATEGQLHLYVKRFFFIEKWLYWLLMAFLMMPYTILANKRGDLCLLLNFFKLQFN